MVFVVTLLYLYGCIVLVGADPLVICKVTDSDIVKEMPWFVWWLSESGVIVVGVVET